MLPPQQVILIRPQISAWIDNVFPLVIKFPSHQLLVCFAIVHDRRSLVFTLSVRAFGNFCSSSLYGLCSCSDTQYRDTQIELRILLTQSLSFLPCLRSRCCHGCISFTRQKRVTNKPSLAFLPMLENVMASRQSVKWYTPFIMMVVTCFSFNLEQYMTFNFMLGIPYT